MTAVGKVTRIFREEGAVAVAAAVPSALGKWWRQGEVWQLRKSSYVRLDGCRINLDSCHSSDIVNLLKTGRYELPERIAVRRYLNDQLPVIELGASIGVVACATNLRLQRRDQHVVVEANPTLIPCLTENRRRNGCGYEILHRAVGYECDVVEMHLHRNNALVGSKYIDGGEVVRIPAIRLREILKSRGFERAALICDIEGSEYELMQHDASVLGERVSLLILELHERMLGQERTHLVRKTLADIGFACVYKNHENYVFRNQRLPS